MLDARRDLVTMRGVSRLIRTTGVVRRCWSSPRRGLTAVNADWGADDVLLDTAYRPRSRPGCGWSPAGSPLPDAEPDTQLIRSGDVVIDEASYTAKLNGRPST